jgi:hypothetical protein
MAESKGFEPLEACTSTVFETVPFVRSGNSPLEDISRAAGCVPSRLSADACRGQRRRSPKNVRSRAAASSAPGPDSTGNS